MSRVATPTVTFAAGASRAATPAASSAGGLSVSGVTLGASRRVRSAECRVQSNERRIYSALCILNSALIRERPVERGAFIRSTPLRIESLSGEGVFLGNAQRGVGQLREGREPLHRAAARVVLHFLVHREQD